MSISDPIADAIAIINNACRARKETAEIPASKVIESIFNILKAEGFIKNYKRIDDTIQGSLKVYFKYTSDSKPIINGMKRISKPGLRKYTGKTEIPSVLGGLGIAIVSTSRGLLTDEAAREAGIGGEVVCYVW